MLTNEEIELDLKMDDVNLFGVYYYFQEEHEITLKRGREVVRRFPILNPEEILNEINRVNINEYKLLFLENGETKFQKKLIDLIYVELNNEMVIKLNSKWYKFNTDYLSYVNEKLNREKILYKEEYNFTNEIEDMTIDSGFYAEWRYNNYLVQNDNNKLLFDRVNIRVATGENIEQCDIYDKNKAECLFVKIGSGTSKLSYNVQQSLTSLYTIKNNNYKFEYNNEEYPIKKFTLLFIIRRGNDYNILNSNIIDSSDVKMFGLKRELIYWCNEVKNCNLEYEIIFAYDRRDN